ncbi:MAG: ATP-grasp domain-containing protein [Chitinophagaceae bacterium]|nr:ATP-grasp domain-containing protein [Chitinophagaceae bacterium]
MEKKNVLVTGIGGNVGQGIVRNIRKTGFEIRVVGTNINNFSAGNHLCDGFYKVPYAYESSFIAEIKEIVATERIDLIIPSTDYEVYYLSAHQKELGCEVAASEPAVAGAYLDKYLTADLHGQFGVPFAATFLPSAYDHRFKEFIVKPRKGRGSRGLFFNPPNISKFSDEEYIVQELCKGQEVTTAFYVDAGNHLHGHITMSRSLENGTTTYCAVTRTYDYQFQELLTNLAAHIPIKGAANIQSIITDKGEIIPFEVNCRISGTNSIRSNFGFEDVRYTLEELLYGRKPTPVRVTDGVAVRILMDVIYPGQTGSEGLTDNQTPFFIY